MAFYSIGKFNNLLNYEFAYSQVIPSPSVNFDYVVTFAYNQVNGFMECDRKVYQGVRLHLNLDIKRLITFGIYFEKTSLLFICKSLFVCLKRKNWENQISLTIDVSS